MGLWSLSLSWTAQHQKASLSPGTATAPTSQAELTEPCLHIA